MKRLIASIALIGGFSQAYAHNKITIWEQDFESHAKSYISKVVSTSDFDNLVRDGQALSKKLDGLTLEEHRRAKAKFQQLVTEQCAIQGTDRNGNTIVLELPASVAQMKRFVQSCKNGGGKSIKPLYITPIKTSEAQISR